MKTITCKYCGKEFETSANNKIYCSTNCRNKMNVAVRREKRNKNKNKQGKKLNLNICEIVRNATSEGLTYGEYVKKYNL